MRLQDLADLLIACLENGVLLLLLRRVLRIGECGDREVLADRRGVGDAAADVARRLCLERLQLLVRRALERKGDEADAKAPHVVLLRRAVELHREDVPVERRKLGEERLAVDALLVDEPEVGVVADDHDSLAGLRGGLHRGDDLLRVRKRRRVAGRVVRKVEDEDFFLSGREQRGLHRGRVKTAALERVEVPDLAADRLLEDELVVVPEEIGADQLVRLTRKELRDDADAVGERVRDDGIRELHALEGRVLLDLHRLPLLAELGQPEASGIEKRLLVEPKVLREALHHERRAVLLERHADRRVDVAALGFCTLSEDAAIGKIHPLARVGEKLHRAAQRLIESLSQLIHLQLPFRFRLFRKAAWPDPSAQDPAPPRPPCGDGTSGASDSRHDSGKGP